MWFGRLKKRFTRALIVSWREQPTRFDIEALQANIRRVGLVVRVRWILIFVLVSYSMLAGAAYLTQMEFVQLARLMAVPAFTLGLVVLYNAFYSANYRRLGNIAVWNNLQLALDALVVTVLVYFSGGVNSWFWSMYALFILEATFILPRSRDTWIHALFSCVLLGTVEWSEYLGWLPHIRIPYSASDFHQDFVFVSVRYMWQAAVLGGIAWVATNMVGEFRREIAASRAQTLVDTSTGLYSRSYFLRTLATEVRRVTRDGRPLHVILVDIDRFGDFNERFGIDRGDRMLQALASTFANAVESAGDVASSTNLAARFGGEEFAFLFAEDERLGQAPTASDALRLAEQLRAAAERVRVDGAGVTVSVGVASLPDDGGTLDALLDAADAALGCAIDEGGNRVVTAAECDPDSRDTSATPVA